MYSLYRVTYGNGKRQSICYYYTWYHAEQFARAKEHIGGRPNRLSIQGRMDQWLSQ
jgi:hypothetical protein